MSYTINFCGAGGILDFRTADNARDAATAAMEMILCAGELHHGDSIQVRSDNPEVDD